MIALYIALGIGAALLAAIVLVLLTQVEDWSRDLSTNVAATSDDAKDEWLRPIRSSLAVNALADATIAAADKIPRWELAEQAHEGEAVRLHFVRTTPLWRFRDDIRVRIETTATGTQLSAESRSRVGKGDLGQNPRNLRELLAAVRAAIQ